MIVLSQKTLSLCGILITLFYRNTTHEQLHKAAHIK